MTTDELLGVDPEEVSNTLIKRVKGLSPLQRAVRSHLLKESPAEDLELPPKPDKRPFVKPSEDDWLRLLNYPTCYYCWKWIILTEYVTGCRLSELLALKWEDLTYTYEENGTLAGGVLHIGHALIRGENENFWQGFMVKKWALVPTLGNSV